MFKLLLLASLAFASTFGLPVPSNLHSYLVPHAIPDIPEPEPTACDLKKLQACGVAFYKEIGYSGNPDDYMAFADYVNRQYLGHGVGGFDKFCSAMGDTAKCYGTDLGDIVKCLTTKNFEAMGVDQQNGEGFAAFFHEFGYFCGPGKAVMDKNFDCLIKVGASSEHHQAQCSKTFADQIKKDPSNKCIYAQQLLECVAQPYATCGKDTEALVCNGVIQSWSQIQYFDSCKFTCKKASFLFNFVPQMPDTTAEQSEPEPTACDLKKLEMCGRAFDKEIGYSGDPGDFAAFAQFIGKKYLSHGRGGFDKFCSAIGDAQKCYGKGFIACLTPKNFEALGMTEQNAVSYAAFFHEYGYFCGAGKKVMDDNYDCLLKVGEQSQQHTEQCSKTFAGQVQKDPKNKCKYAQELLDCVKEPHRACGKDAEMLICNGIIQNWSQIEYLSSCKYTCGKSSFFASFVPKDLPSVPEPAPCDIKKLEMCGQRFYQELGYKGDPGDVKAFVKFVNEQYFQHGVAAFDKYCGVVADTKKCYGDDLFKCLTTANFEKMGLDKESATEYAVFLQETGYYCGPVKKVFDDNYDCIGKVSKGSEAHTEKCSNTFQDQIRKDPKNKCKYSQEFLTCISQPWSVCGKDAQMAVCGGINVGWKQIDFFSSCKLTCGKKSFNRNQAVAELTRILPAVPQPQMPACDMGKLMDCGQKFFAEVGYTGDPADYQAFAAYIGKKYGKDKDGFDAFCKVLSDAEKCYGQNPGADLISCITVANLQSLGLDREAASFYAVFFHEQGYQCGPGKQIIDKNFDCIIKVRDSSTQHDQQCVDTFKKEIQKDPQNVCKYTNEYVGCLSDPFKECGNLVRSEVCGTVAAGLEQVIPCKIACAK